jgi:hypothetical protein
VKLSYSDTYKLFSGSFFKDLLAISANKAKDFKLLQEIQRNVKIGNSMDYNTFHSNYEQLNPYFNKIDMIISSTHVDNLILLGLIFKLFIRFFFFLKLR